MNGRNVIIGCCMMVGVNAISEMVASEVITGAIGAALSKARLLPSEKYNSCQRKYFVLESVCNCVYLFKNNGYKDVYKSGV